MPSPLGITTSGERGILFKYKYNSSSNSNSSGSGQNVRSSFKINYNTNENTTNTNSNAWVNSMFNNNKWYYRPTGLSETLQSKDPSKIHRTGQEDIYDTSINSLLRYTSQYQSMTLREVDFAYLKDLGVYPNNRLIVARRFATPVQDDLTAVEQRPMTTLISWFDEESNPVKVSFGEKWTDGQGNIIELLDKMFNMSVLGGGVSALDSMMKGAVPLPGFSEGLQFELLKQMGFTDAGLDNVPSGNPNLVWQSKRRELIGQGGGSGLKSDVAIDFETTYEQKFIAGNDPTLVYFDILNNILRFGSSESSFYLNGKGSDFISNFIDKFRKGKWLEAMSYVVSKLIDAIKGIISTLWEGLKQAGQAVGDAVSGDTSGITDLITSTLATISGAIFSKYRVELNGIISSLSGEPSTPWHVTVGNPKAPIFSSGDMLCDNVTIDLGETLAFNDLPSTITVKFKLKSARSLGIQEIFRKYNTGRGRIYQYVDPSLYEQKGVAEDFNKLNGTTNQSGSVTDNLNTFNDNLKTKTEVQENGKSQGNLTPEGQAFAKNTRK